MAKYAVRFERSEYGRSIDKTEHFDDAYDAYKAYKAYVFADDGGVVSLSKDGKYMRSYHCDSLFKFEMDHFYDRNKHGIRYCGESDDDRDYHTDELIYVVVSTFISMDGTDRTDIYSCFYYLDKARAYADRVNGEVYYGCTDTDGRIMPNYKAGRL